MNYLNTGIMNYNIKETTQFSKDLKELIRNGFDVAD